MLASTTPSPFPTRPRATGPKTPAGKRVSSRNRRTHGLLSGTTLLPSENARAFGSLRGALEREFAAVGAVEELLVERIVSASWRLRRATKIEAALLEEHRRNNDGTDGGLGLALTRTTVHGDTLSLLIRYESALRREVDRCMAELERRQRARAGEFVPAPQSVAVSITAGGDDREARADGERV